MYRSSFAFVPAMAALAAILLPSSLPAQITFQRTYGGPDGDLGRAVQQTTDGGYIVAGYTASYGTGGIDIYLVKTDASGDTLWTRTYGGGSDDCGYSVQQTSDGGYVIAGVTRSQGAGGDDVYLIKTGPAGETLWTRTYGGTADDNGYAVQQTADGGYIIAGYTWSFGAGLWDVYLIKANADGDTLWTRAFGGRHQDVSYSVQQTADGGYVIAGITSSYGAGGADIYLIKTDANGDVEWTRTYGTTESDEGYAVQQTTDGGYIVAGMTTSFGAGRCDVYLIKTSASGDTLWTRTFGGDHDEYGYSVHQVADGGYVIAGTTRSFGAGIDDIYLIKTSASGNALWTRTFGGDSFDYGHSVHQTADGGYVIAGYTLPSGASAYDVYLIKTDSLGNVAVAEPKTSPTRTPALSLSCEPNPFSGTTTVRLSRHSPFAIRP
jgi:hypothetical protein